MRSLKFRGWHTEAKDMVYFELGQDYIPCMSEEEEMYTFRLEDGHPVMQFTGLQDKDGVEIYEGDILEIAYEYGNMFSDHEDEGVYRGVVHFRPSSGFGLAQVTVRSEVDETVKRRSGLERIVASKALVVSNAHQDPELLQEPSQCK